MTPAINVILICFWIWLCLRFTLICQWNLTYPHIPMLGTSSDVPLTCNCRRLHSEEGKDFRSSYRWQHRYVEYSHGFIMILERHFLTVNRFYFLTIIAFLIYWVVTVSCYCNGFACDEVSQYVRLISKWKWCSWHRVTAQLKAKVWIKV